MFVLRNVDKDTIGSLISLIVLQLLGHQPNKVLPGLEEPQLGEGLQLCFPTTKGCPSEYLTSNIQDRAPSSLSVVVIPVSCQNIMCIQLSCVLPFSMLCFLNAHHKMQGVRMEEMVSHSSHLLSVPCSKEKLKILTGAYKHQIVKLFLLLATTKGDDQEVTSCANYR